MRALPSHAFSQEPRCDGGAAHQRQYAARRPRCRPGTLTQGLQAVGARGQGTQQPQAPQRSGGSRPSPPRRDTSHISSHPTGPQMPDNPARATGSAHYTGRSAGRHGNGKLTGTRGNRRCLTRHAYALHAGQESLGRNSPKGFSQQLHCVLGGCLPLSGERQNMRVKQGHAPLVQARVAVT